MPLDSICLTALLNELRPQLIGGRIDKIYQPGKDDRWRGARAPGRGPTPDGRGGAGGAGGNGSVEGARAA